MNITQTVQLEEMVCRTCGITHAVPYDWLQNRRSNGGDIHCPNGCRRGWWKSDADRLREQLEVKERELRESKCEVLRKQQSLDFELNEKAKLERKLKRVNKGVCPCCNRSFANLARHMETKHPIK